MRKRCPTCNGLGRVPKVFPDGTAMAYCVGTTKSGAPKHPLYIKTGTFPQEYRA